MPQPRPERFTSQTRRIEKVFSIKQIFGRGADLMHNYF
jgi:hypothetical protein